MTTGQILRIAAARQHAKAGTGRTIRERARLSVQEVAAALGVSVASLSRWERGLHAPRGDVAARWAQLLDDLQRAADVAEGR